MAPAVMALGLLGLVALQGMPARNADVARQRTKATRLAQERIEAMRACTGIGPLVGQTSWEGLANGADTRSSNTTCQERQLRTSTAPPAARLDAAQESLLRHT